VTLSRPISWLLIAFAAWSWVIWPTFLKNISGDPRSWDAHGGATSFFTVHLVLTVVSLLSGTLIGVLGVRGLFAPHRTASQQKQDGQHNTSPSDLRPDSVSREQDHVDRV